MGETDSIQPATPLAPPPPLSYISAPLAARPAVAGINYFRFTPQEAGWTSVASFGTASVWHLARDLLAQRRIICRMVADPTHTRTEDQRIDLLVMASEAEWAREVLRQGIPEVAGSAFPPEGLAMVPAAVSAPGSGVPPPLPEGYFLRHRVAAPDGAPVPVAALPIAPLRAAQSRGQSVGYTIVLVIAFVVFIVLALITAILLIAPFFAPG